MTAEFWHLESRRWRCVRLWGGKPAIEPANQEAPGCPSQAAFHPSGKAIGYRPAPFRLCPSASSGSNSPNPRQLFPIRGPDRAPSGDTENDRTPARAVRSSLLEQQIIQTAGGRASPELPGAFRRPHVPAQARLVAAFVQRLVRRNVARRTIGQADHHGLGKRRP